MNQEDKDLLYPQDEIKKQQDGDDKARVARERELDDIRVVLSTAQGRRWVWRMLGSLGLMRSPFVAGNPDITGFNSGKHDEALKLVIDIEEAVPGVLFKIQNEYRSAQASDQKGQR